MKKLLALALSASLLLLSSCSFTDPVEETTAPTPAPTATPTLEPTPMPTPKPTPTPEPVYTADADGLRLLAEDKFQFAYDGLEVAWDDFDEAYAVTFHSTDMPLNETTWVYQAVNRYIWFCQYAYQIDGLDRVRFNVMADGMDQYGNEVTFEGLEVLMTRENFKKFEWDNLAFMEIWDSFNDNCYVFSLSNVFSSELDTSKIFYDPLPDDGMID